MAQTPSKTNIPEHMQGWWESLHVTTAHNMTDPNSGIYQPGGVGIFNINWAAHWVQSFRSNPTGLGQ